VVERLIEVELDEAAQVGLQALMAEGMTDSEAIRTALVEAGSSRERSSRRTPRPPSGTAPGSAVTGDDLDPRRSPGSATRHALTGTGTPHRSRPVVVAASPGVGWAA
jgi:hypothetical protein